MEGGESNQTHLSIFLPSSQSAAANTKERKRESCGGKRRDDGGVGFSFLPTPPICIRRHQKKVSNGFIPPRWLNNFLSPVLRVTRRAFHSVWRNKKKRIRERIIIQASSCSPRGGFVEATRTVKMERLI